MHRTIRPMRRWLRALKSWTPQPACLWRVLFGDAPDAARGCRGGRASW